MLSCLWYLAGIKHGRAVLSGVRIEAAMGYINRIAEADEWPSEVRSKWQKLFTQLGHINKLRNNILHFGTTPTIDGDRWLVSNREIAHHPSRIREAYVTPAILNNAEDDLGFIDVHAFTLMMRQHPKIPRDALPDFDRELKNRTWRYRSQPQAVQVRTTQRTLPKQPRSPRPSRA